MISLRQIKTCSESKAFISIFLRPPQRGRQTERHIVVDLTQTFTRHNESYSLAGVGEGAGEGRGRGLERGGGGGWRGAGEGGGEEHAEKCNF